MRRESAVRRESGVHEDRPSLIASRYVRRTSNVGSPQVNAPVVRKLAMEGEEVDRRVSVGAAASFRAARRESIDGSKKKFPDREDEVSIVGGAGGAAAVAAASEAAVRNAMPAAAPLAANAGEGPSISERFDDSDLSFENVQRLSMSLGRRRTSQGPGGMPAGTPRTKRCSVHLVKKIHLGDDSPSSSEGTDESVDNSPNEADARFNTDPSKCAFNTAIGNRASIRQPFGSRAGGGAGNDDLSWIEKECGTAETLF